MIKILLLLVRLYLATLINTKPIVQNKNYEVKRKVINTSINEFCSKTKDVPAPVAPFNQ